MTGLGDARAACGGPVAARGERGLDPMALAGRAVYVAGPMSGVEGFNRPAFDVEAKRCYEMGARFVVNPADLVPLYESGRITRAQCVKSDLNKLLLCDTVVMLPGWQESPGALLERDVALACGMLVIEADAI